MTRAMCSRTSKRKPIKLSQDIISENCKENSPCIISKSKATSKESNYIKHVQTRSRVLTPKENIVVGNNHQNSTSFYNKCNLRKSERHCISSFNRQDYVYDIPKGKIKSDTSAKRNVLSDKTNSPTSGTKTNSQSEALQTTLNKCNNLTKLTNPCQLNDSCTDKTNSKPHILVYNTVDPSDIVNTTSNLPLEKKEAVYEFDEVDENEEPVKKRKKKRKVNIRKPKIGPKALTINNIKYNSTESLVSLPEKPERSKKTKPKRVAPCLKSYSSVNNLNDSEDTFYSVQSFMSHPPSLLLCNKRELKNKHELSVLQETQSENCQSPVHEISNRLSNVEHLSEIIVDNHLTSNAINISSVLPNDSRLSQINSAVPQRCYPSKKNYCEYSTHRISQCGSINDSLPNHLSHCSANISSGSSHDFLSSTPCKRTSFIARHNSVFSDSYDRDIPNRLRPSTGFINDASENMVIDDDKCFGFDEPEELEEPLVSPIKNINLQEPRVLPRCRHELPLFSEIENPKPDLKEVIEQLKASIPKAKTKETSEVFNSDSSSSDHSIPSSPIIKEVETTLSFIKPPRRSYERQRRIRYYSEHQEEDKEEENHGENDDSQQRDKDYGERENVLKPAKKCYKKKNVSKVFKAPHVPKAKQRILKEEEELERLAAQMNAQFQEIDKCNLVVE